MRWLLLHIAVLAAPWPLAAQRAAFEPVRSDGAWFRGNTHTHTSLTDGDVPAADVVAWYRARGYQFLALTDHDTLAVPSAPADSAFVLIAGEEVTANFDGKPVHVNGLGLQRTVAPVTAATLAGTLQANVDAVAEAGGIAQVNHPNFHWTLDAGTLRATNGITLLEIFNGHPHVNNEGGGGAPSAEELWDAMLSAGMRVYGVASDDAHHWLEEFAAHRSNPGHGWIVVRAGALTADSILSALQRGDFYASTGVVIDELRTDGDRLTVRLPPHRHFRRTITFLGADNRVLAEIGADSASYTLRGGERYVRVRISESSGARAWTQPVYVRHEE